MNTALLADARTCRSDTLSILFEMHLLDYVTAATALWRESPQKNITRFQPVSMLLLCTDHRERDSLYALFRKASRLDVNLDIKQQLLTVQIETIDDFRSMLLGLLANTDRTLSEQKTGTDWEPHCLQTLQSLIWQHSVRHTPGALGAWYDLPYTQTGWTFLQENVFSQRPSSAITLEENRWQENHWGVLKLCIDASREQLASFLQSEFLHADKKSDYIPSAQADNMAADLILAELKNNKALLEKMSAQYPLIYHTTGAAEKTPSILDSIHSLPLVSVTVEDVAQTENTDEIWGRGPLFSTWETEIEHLINHLSSQPDQKGIIAFDIDNTYHQTLLNTIEPFVSNRMAIQFSDRLKQTLRNKHKNEDTKNEDLWTSGYLYLTEYLLLTTPQLRPENFNAQRVRTLLSQWLESLYLACLGSQNTENLSANDLQFTLGQWLQKAAAEHPTLDIQMIDNNAGSYITLLEETLPEELHSFLRKLREHIPSCEHPSAYFQFLLENYDAHFSRYEKNPEAAHFTEFTSHFQRATADCVARIRNWENTLEKWYPICFANQHSPLSLQDLLPSCIWQWSYFWQYSPPSHHNSVIICDYSDLNDSRTRTKGRTEEDNTSIQIFLPALCESKEAPLKTISQNFRCHVSAHQYPFSVRETIQIEEIMAEAPQWTPHPHFSFFETDKVADIQPIPSQLDLFPDTTKASIQKAPSNPIFGPTELISISPSDIQTYLECPRRYYYQSVLKLPQTETDASIRGTLVHRIMEVFLNHVFANREMENVSKITWSDESLRFITQRLFDLDSDYFKESDLIKIRSLDPVALSDLKRNLHFSIDSLKEEGFFTSHPQNVTSEKKLSYLYQTKDSGPWEFTGRVDALFEYSIPNNPDAIETVLLDFKTGTADLTQTQKETRDKHLLHSFTPLQTNRSPQASKRKYYVPLPLYTWLCQENQIPLSRIGLQFIRPKAEKASGSVSVTLDTSEFRPEEWLESLNETVLIPIRQSEHFDVKPSKDQCKRCQYNVFCEGPSLLNNQSDADDDNTTGE
ncbi:MAG: PD-(D/E)XK nuclease family protein [Cyanobacteria bacterium]|nr:PD-(D/E)XK nuclease family protein [Cyanobacteriota bacterium]